ncbi:MAG: hypothetical protein AB7N29_14070 [Vicinamibacterales bacterium]
MNRLFLAAVLLGGAWSHQAAPKTEASVPGFFDLAVTGGTATFAALGLEPEERGVALPVLARRFHGQGADRGGAELLLAAVFDPPGGAPPPPEPDSQPITIAAPLTADHWRDVLDLGGRDDLFPALISNRPALLVSAAALAADPTLRRLLERDRGLLRWLVANAPGVFHLAARGLRVENDRIAVPGGLPAVPIWEAIVGTRVTQPADFIRALMARDDGRLAWFYATVAAMAPERVAAVLGPGPLEAQIEQTRAMAQAFRTGDQNWRIDQHPYLRGVADAWMVTSLVALTGSVVAPPNAQWLWEAVFEGDDVSRREAAGLDRSAGSPVTLAWLAAKIASSPPRERRERFETVRFAQTVFGATTEAEATDVAVALAGYRRYRALLVTLDRIDIRAPQTYARAIEAARRIDGRPRRERQLNLVAFQGALAIVERARISRAITAAAAEQLVLSLAEAVDRDAPFMPAVAQWLTTTLSDTLPRLVRPDRWTAQTAYESKILQAMAGPVAEAGLPEVEWEGLRYRLDPAAADHQRILEVREQLESPGLDAALASGEPQQIADALLAIVYAPALGDPAGPALLGADIITRHDFGLDAPAAIRRAGMAWGLPREHVGDGVPWRIQGALLGLELGLARLSLRRLADNEMPVEPTLNLNDQLTIARSIHALNARELTDAHRDRIVEAIARGRRRVADAATNPASMLALAAEVRASFAVRETLPWMLSRSPETVPALFGLRDLMWLGKPAMTQAELDRWGVYAEGLDGRVAAAMPPPAPWEDYGGRPDGGIMGTQAPDLILRLAEETARLGLPAALVPPLLTFAAQDYWHDVSARSPDDWPAMTRQALALSPSRVEDYVAALAGNGPLRSQ